jgi:hypothetical protein
MSELRDFKKELRALLEKYEAAIYVDYSDCSDMHGVYDQNMTVSFRRGKAKQLTYGWGITKGDF